MKNKKTLTYLLFCYFVFFLNNVITEEIQIDSTEINILKNGDVIKGSDGFEVNADNNIKITGKNFEYDKKNSKLLATGNVVLIDKQSEIIIESENINYLKNEEKIFIKGRSKINFKNKFDISTENPIYLKNKGEIYSDYKTIIIDELKNKIVLNKFHLDKKTNIVSGKNVELNYNNSDTYFFENLKYNLNDQNLLGKDFYLVLNNPNPKENNYRIKGRTISDNNKKSFISSFGYLI